MTQNPNEPDPPETPTYDNDSSILNDVKKSLGIPSDHTAFDNEIILHINSTFAVVTQLGVGPNAGYAIQGPENTWREILEDITPYNLVKSYIFLRVKLLFDVSGTGAVLSVYKDQIESLEWRINIHSEDIRKGDRDESD